MHLTSLAAEDMFPEVRTRFCHEVTQAIALPPLLGAVGAVEHLATCLAVRLAPENVEVFYAIYCNAKGAPIHTVALSRGTISSTLVHPREVFAPALICGAAAVIVAHNHPSGDPQPSADDRTTTRRLQKAARLLGVTLLDHIIVGHGGAYYSFLETGVM